MTPNTVAVEVFVSLFLIFFFFLVIYAFFCLHNWYCHSTEYMNVSTCQQEQTNKHLERISQSLEIIAYKK